MKKHISKVLFILEKEEKIQSIKIFLLTLFCSVAELISIGLIIPILQIFTGNSVTSEFSFISQNYLDNPEYLLTLILIGFLLVYFLKFYLNRLLIKKQNIFSHNLNARVAKKLLNIYLNRDFSFFVKTNSSELIRNIDSESALFSMGLMLYLLRLVSDLIMFIFISTFLLFYNLPISLISIFLFTFFGFILFRRNQKKLKSWGIKRQYHVSKALKQLQQSFASYRELIMNNLINMFYKEFSYHTDESAKIGAEKDLTTQMPRLILEILAVLILVIIINILIFNGEKLQDILVLLGVLFYCTMRLLPTVSRIVVSFQNIKFNHVVLNLIYDEFKQKEKILLENINENFNNSKAKNFQKIVFENVAFAYSNEKIIFKRLNLEINNGDKIGIIGKTGSGKSTFVNILCGLLNPQKGKTYLDDSNDSNDYKSIQKITGYVPQSVSVFDETILFNIGLKEKFNDEEISKIHKILKLVNLSEVVDKLPNNINEKIGEHGSKFSGGQNQRLGIARALFKDPSILILDEASSALDLKTEELLFNNLLSYNSKLTIIIITHRLTPLKFCNKIFELENYDLKRK